MPFYGKCPYCNFTCGGSEYKSVKEELKRHMLNAHYDTLLQEFNERRKRYRRPERMSLKWYVGMKAAFSIEERS